MPIMSVRAVWALAAVVVGGAVVAAAGPRGAARAAPPAARPESMAPRLMATDSPPAADLPTAAAPKPGILE
ncbi:MAG: hypothetical protein ACKOEP_06425, partial [Phycisphaerales bacterium]